MSYMLEILGRALPDSLWPVFREYLNDAPARQAQRPTGKRTHCHVMAGVAALQHASGGQAKLHFDRAISSRDRTPAAIIGMACALDMLGQAGRARRYLRLAMEKHPDDAKLHYAMGLLEERSNEPDRAVPLYQHSIYFQPNQKSSRMRLMALAMARGDYAAAAAQAEAVATQFPLEMPNWTRLGGLQLLTEDPARAVQSFQEALKLLADNWQSKPDRGEPSRPHEQIDEAIQHLERAIASGQNYADLHVRLGDLYNAQHRDQDAQEEYKQALRVNPYYLEATTKVAAGHIRSGQHEQAALWLGQALDINETILVNYVGQSLAHAYMGRDAEGRADLEMARGIASNAPVLMAEIARLHMAAMRQGPAQDGADESNEMRSLSRGRVLERSIQAHLAWLAGNPDDAAAWVRLGMLLEADKQPDYAREVYAKAVETYPGCTFALVRLGLAGQEGQAKAGPVAAAGPDDTTGVDARDSAGMLRRVFWPDGIDVGTHYGLSTLFSQVQRFEVTAEQFGETLSSDQNQSFWRNVALALEQMGMLNRPKCLWQSLTEIQVEPVGTGPEGGQGGEGVKG